MPSDNDDDEEDGANGGDQVVVVQAQQQAVDSLWSSIQSPWGSNSGVANDFTRAGVLFRRGRICSLKGSPCSAYSGNLLHISREGWETKQKFTNGQIKLENSINSWEVKSQK